MADLPTGVVLDTSFLVPFVKADATNHAVAGDWFRHCIRLGIPMYVPTMVLMEFARKHPFEALLAQGLIPLPFNVGDAALAARFAEARPTPSNVSRPETRTDVAIIAQAHRQGCSVILTEDENTLRKYCDVFRGSGLCKVHAVLLQEGFDPQRLVNPDQPGLFGASAVP